MMMKNTLNKLITSIAIIVPFIGVFVAIFFMWNRGFNWVDLCLMLGMYITTALGISIGFHRLFVHRSFETYMWVKFILAVMGSMALQGSLFQWVAIHRCHHQHSDTPDDPHSPHHQEGHGIIGTLRGWWHSHIGWFFCENPPNIFHYIKDLQTSPTLHVASYLWPLWFALGIAIPTVLGGLITMSWMGALTGFLWGGAVRVFLVHHVTWSVNSACHLWGFQPYKSDDMSRNNVIFGVLAMGEGWHNTHHAFPTSARHGLRFFEIDVSYYLIYLLSKLHIVWNVKLPTQEAQRLAKS
jgi:stearoyl-CoA desaturase (Delta-9 desaturase)